MKILTIEEEAKNLAARFEGVNRAAFAREHKLKGGQSVIYQHMTARRPISLGAALVYAKGFGCNLEDISPRLAKEASQAISQTGGKADSNVEVLEQVGTVVPLISWVQAGQWCEAIDLYNVGDAEEWLPCPVKHGPRTYALRVRGESMFNPSGQPSFADGDIIFCDPDRDVIHKSLVIGRLDQSKEATFKRLLIDDSRRFLEALNPSWPNRIFEIDEDACVCGVVIARLESFV